MEFFAPAKVNLSLRVLRRREDGFHEIESLMCPLSIFDTLDLSHREEGGLEFTCDDPTIPPGDDNLVVRAAKLFCASCGFEPRLRIHLTKRIPHGAGLGGGSSDAATTLIGLNRLFETELSREALSAMAADLGSDIPFFIYQSAAVIRGRGEFVEPVAFPHELPLFLIKPPFGVPTPWAYKHWRDSREVPGVRYEAQEFPWGTLVNDLERPVFEKYLFLADVKTWLLGQEEVSGALMSGSGATVFAVLRDKDAAESLAAKVSAEFGTNLWCCLCETIAN
ncbi:MAG TPA: 4-(cytidine 5'-diphospho)-2-C-methyl-D-erythritol kinase [Chthoniobacter sp.]|nr:4-(cytidine 5'-diphospho)-2-C-methyl-D-erythritol kinase [Chthoniobacter sp.]